MQPRKEANPTWIWLSGNKGFLSRQTSPETRDEEVLKDIGKQPKPAYCTRLYLSLEPSTLKISHRG